jgi:hypothetical protein
LRDKKFDSFSVPLGLLDYVNPILYTVTVVTVIRNTFVAMGAPYNRLMLIGAAVSVFFGLIIPTGKVLVGLGIIDFVMPVSLVFSVNAGILVFGLTLLRYVMGLSNFVWCILLAAIVTALISLYRKTKKLNTVAVLTGAAGYLLTYISLIALSVRSGVVLPIILYAMAIALFVFLCGVGIKADLYNPKVHWVIEISNVVCQLLVAVATVILLA